MVSSELAKLELAPLRKSNKEPVGFVEQYVKEVADFSSQYGSNSSISYTAYNIAGKPSKFPDYGDFPHAFVMRTYGRWWDESPSGGADYQPQNNEYRSHDYIDLDYHAEVYPIRVSIYETYNPGSVVAIWARESRGQWQRLWQGPPQKVAQRARIFSPALRFCRFKTCRLRLEFDHSDLEYYTELDAVLLIGTTELILPRASLGEGSVSDVLRSICGNNADSEDPLNLTDKADVNGDIELLKKALQEHCVVDRLTDKLPKGKLAAKLGVHCHCVPPIEEAFNSLQQFLQEELPKFMRDIAPSPDANASPNGSFANLPDETLLKILRQLDLRSLSRCCRVSKHFNRVARDALLYTSLNLKPYWHCCDDDVVRSLASRCRYLRRLDMSWCGSYGAIKSAAFVGFLRECGHGITHLRLNSCGFVDDDVVVAVAAICRRLQDLCLRNCSNVSSDGFSRLADLTSLRRLELYRANIETAALCGILRRNGDMRHLNLAGMHDRLNMDEVALAIAKSCPRLESIDCWKAQTLSPKGVRALARCTRLREVDFGWCGGMGAPGDSLRTFLECCPNLEKVFLAALRGLTDRDLEPLLLSSRLQQLDLLGARSLSADLCLRFLLYCPRLRMIDLSFCEAIAGSKIQEWRSLYPRVSIKRSFQSSGP